MTTIDQLFSTPEQGRRLNELVPELTSAMEWIRIHAEDEFEKLPYFSEEWDKTKPCFDEFTPALTLQELRDLARKAEYGKFEREGVFLLDSFDQRELEYLIDTGTAPELAQWVIDRFTENDNA